MLDNIKLTEIKYRSDNPRKQFETEALTELAASIKANGVLEPVLLRKTDEGLELVAGERRCRAAIMAGLDKIPAIIRELTEIEVARIQLTENVARREMNPIEEHIGVARLVELGESFEAIADCTGRSAAWVQLRLELGELPELIRSGIAEGSVSLGVAEQLLSLPTAERPQATQQVLELGEEISARRVSELLELRYHRPRRLQKLWEKTRQKCTVGRPVETYAERDLCLEPWGKPKAGFAQATDPLGGAAARLEDAAITWQALAAAHEIELIAVPTVDALGWINLADVGLIRAAESALRKAGQPYTLGPRLAYKESEREAIEAAEMEPIAEETLDLQEVLNAVMARLVGTEQSRFSALISSVIETFSEPAPDLVADWVRELPSTLTLD